MLLQRRGTQNIRLPSASLPAFGRRLSGINPVLSKAFSRYTSGHELLEAWWVIGRMGGLVALAKILVGPHGIPQRFIVGSEHATSSAVVIILS